MDLNDWMKKNLVEELNIDFSKIKVIAQNKDGTLKLNADGRWVNKCSIAALKAATDNKLHIVYRKKEDWKNPAWVTVYDWSKEEENGSC